MLKLEHVGIAVKDIAISNALFSSLLNTTPYKQETVISESVKTSFFKAGDTKIELLEAQNENSAISKFIEKRGEGIHHLAFEVENIENEIDRLKNEGFIFISDEPKSGADNKRICFLHPKGTNGVLIELCEEIK